MRRALKVQVVKVLGISTVNGLNNLICKRKYLYATEKKIYSNFSGCEIKSSRYVLLYMRRCI